MAAVDFGTFVGIFYVEIALYGGAGDEFVADAVSKSFEYKWIHYRVLIAVPGDGPAVVIAGVHGADRAELF